MENNVKNKAVCDKISVLIFLIIIFGFTLATLIVPKKEFSANENRNLAQMPKFSFESLKSGEFGKNYDEYLSDQFVLRDTWIAIKTLSDMALQKKDINGVYLGKDNYLFETHDFVDEANAKKNADRMISFVNKYGDVLGKDNVQVMLVPTAGVTLNDKMPAYAITFDQNTYMDDIKSQINKGTFIDVREMLSDKKGEYIYYKTDHHMTSLGNYYLYCQWAKVNDVNAKSLNDYNISSKDGFAGSLYSKINFALELDRVDVYKPKDDVNYQVTYDKKNTSNELYVFSALEEKDKYQVFLGGNHSEIRIKSDNHNGKKLLVIRDSYANSFIPFISDNYEEVIMVDFRYYRSSVSKLIEEENVTNILVMYNTATFAEDLASSGFTR